MYIIFNAITDETVCLVRTIEEVEAYMNGNKDLAWQPVD